MNRREIDMISQDAIRTVLPRNIRNWARSPRKTALYIFATLRSIIGRSETVGEINGWQLVCDPRSRRPFEAFWTDSSQRAELEDFLSTFGPRMQFIDIGAHHGFYTLAALHFGGVETKVVAVEASSAATKVLYRNVILNEKLRSVKVYNVAMGDVDGEIHMLSTGPFSDDYMLGTSDDRNDAVVIQQRSLDSLIEDLAIIPTHIKIDVEGFELEVLTGAQKTLKRGHPILLMELHNHILRTRGINPEAVIRLLQDAGYSIFRRSAQDLTIDSILASSENVRLVCRTQ
jgi:FkbM family methyltransferase